MNLIEAFNNEFDNCIAYVSNVLQNYTPQVSFSWLFHENASGWLIELVFWTWAGLLVNSVILLNTALREDDYDSNRFFLFIPRFFIAPLLSIVVVAMIAAGFTDAGLDLTNLPSFLLLSFLLGFNVENLTHLVHKASNTLFGNLVKFKPPAQKPPEVPDKAVTPLLKVSNLLEKYKRKAENKAAKLGQQIVKGTAEQGGNKNEN